MRIAVVSPRLHEPGTVGGAETLLHSLALDAAALGHSVELLCTCAKDHRTWANELPPGAFERDGITVRRFPVDERDLDAWIGPQLALQRGEEIPDADAVAWLENSVNSRALVARLLDPAAGYDRVVAGPYLFGLTWNVARAVPEKTLLVPCFHDEPYAHVGPLLDAFRRVRGFLFNTEPERELAHRLMPGLAPRAEAVVAMGLEPFEADKSAFARRTGLRAPYVLYSGRREEGKGTPLLVDYMDAFRRRTGRDVHLAMTGSGDVQVPTSLAPAFHDLGFVSEAEKREAMAGAVAFVHPSLNESLSIVLLESWLARTPALVHARSPVLRSQCERAGGGLWFRDYPEFEEELLRLLDDPATAAALAASGRAWTVATYAPDAVRARLARALEA